MCLISQENNYGTCKSNLRLIMCVYTFFRDNEFLPRGPAIESDNFHGQGEFSCSG